MENSGKCVKHSLITLIAFAAVKSIKRFAGVSDENLIRRIHGTVSKKAASS